MEKRAAPRPRIDHFTREDAVATLQGVILAARWLRDGRTPSWAHQNTPREWAVALRAAAAHGWTSSDLNDTVDEFARHVHSPIAPATPVAWMRWLLNRQDLDFAPHVLSEAARAQEFAATAAARDESAARHAEHQDGRRLGRAAVGSPGHRAALEIAARATRRRRYPSS